MKVPIGLQVWPVQKEFVADVPGTLQAIAKMGYDGVELCYYWPQVWDHADDIRKVCDGEGLKVVGSHVRYPDMQGDTLKRLIEFSQAVGQRNIIVATLPEEILLSRAKLLETAAWFNWMTTLLRAEGLRLGYHNHAKEFVPVEGGDMPWDLLIGLTVPDMIMQEDIGHVVRGNADPFVYLERYPGRAKLVHIRGFSATDPNVLVGEGDLDWQRLFKVCEGVGGTEWYIVEQSATTLSPMETAQRCLENWRKMGK